MTDTRADVQVIPDASLIGFRPVSQRARDFLGDTSESYQWLGDVLYIDRRFAANLGQALISEGFTVA